MKNYGFGKLAVACFLSPIWGGMLMGIFVESGSAAYEFGVDALSVCFGAGFVFLILWAVSTDKERAADRAAREEKREQEKEKQELRRIEHEKAKAEMQRVFAEDKKRKEADRIPVSAVLISTNSKKSGVNAAGRAIVGGTLLGPVGAIAGAATGSSKATSATFSVKYASGRVATETVPIGSQRFKELSALLHK